VSIVNRPPSSFWRWNEPSLAGGDTHWDNQRGLNQMLIQARSELDEGKRRAMYAELQAILRDEGDVIVPMYANYVFAH
jgi:peptide/nickel transport system substrate-binding protein